MQFTTQHQQYYNVACHFNHDIHICSNLTVSVAKDTEDSARCARDDVLPEVQLADIFSYVGPSDAGMAQDTHVITQSKYDLSKQISFQCIIGLSKLAHLDN